MDVILRQVRDWNTALQHLGVRINYASSGTSLTAGVEPLCIDRLGLLYSSSESVATEPPDGPRRHQAPTRISALGKLAV